MNIDLFGRAKRNWAQSTTAKGLLVGFQPKADEPLAQRRSFARYTEDFPPEIHGLEILVEMADSEPVNDSRIFFS